MIAWRCRVARRVKHTSLAFRADQGPDIFRKLFGEDWRRYQETDIGGGGGIRTLEEASAPYGISSAAH